MRTTLSLVALLLVGAVVAISRPPALVAAAPLAILGHDRVAELPAYGASGTTAVGYRHGQPAVVELALGNRGAVPVTIHRLEPFPELLGLVETVAGEDLPVLLGPGEVVTLTAEVRFANCEYYTERAVNRFDRARVRVERLGATRTLEVAYPREVVLRSPTILGCPERSTDRSARQRMLARDE